MAILVASCAYAQERFIDHRIVVDIPFLFGEGDRGDIRYDIDSVVLANSLRELRLINEDLSLKVKKVVFYGSVSPEGTVAFNRRLGKARMTTAEILVRENLFIDESVPVEYDERYIPWHDYLLPAIEADTTLPYRDELMQIIYRSPDAEGPDNRRVQLRQARGGELWDIVAERYFEHMRKGGAEITVARVVFDELLPAGSSFKVGVDGVAVEDMNYDDAPVSEEQVAEEPKGFNTGFHIKTDAAGWAMAQANVAVEFDFAQRWSVVVPFYYSGINYFARTVKFRTCSVRPELRYYLLKNRSLFLGAHFAMSYFNYAFNQEYRYQDKDGRHPALGGGLTVGYRLPLSKKNDHWNVEFFVGAGVYDVKYDIFRNVKNGALVGSGRKTYVGLDNVGVSFSYRFDWKRDKKSGK